MDEMTRHVSATVEARLSGAQRLELMVALPVLDGVTVQEQLSVLLDGRPVEPTEVLTAHGSRSTSSRVPTAG